VKNYFDIAWTVHCTEINL